MQLFYSTEIEGQTAFFSEEESLHCIKVLRHHPGDSIHFVDGKGGFYKGLIKHAHAKKTEIQILEAIQDYEKRPYSIHIALAPTKNIERTEWFLEKAVEIGIDEVSFIRCTHSERKQINMERMKKIALSAMKQSLKAFLPTIHGIISFEECISSFQQEQKLIAHLGPSSVSLQSLLKPNGNYGILIGPEGDFTEEEIQKALALQFVPVQMGHSRLRTETAALVACHTCHLIQEIQ